MTRSRRTGSGAGTGGKEKEGAMRRGIRALFFGLVIAGAAAWAASAAWQADFTPSTFNPDVGDVVNFAVCETCLGSGGAYRYLWDFNSDGVVDVDTDSPVTACTFNAAGFYEVKLAIQDLGGREVTRRKGVFVGPVSAYGVRQIVPQEDGSLMVVVSIYVDRAPGGVTLIESLPQGWQIQLIDTGGAFLAPFVAEERKYYVTWIPSSDPGWETTFSYYLTRSYGEEHPRLTGEVSGYVDGARFVGFVCGELSVP